MIHSATSSRILPDNGSGSLWDMIRPLRVTTFIGAGGKTTCLRSLTHEIESAGRQVVATTTTKVYPEESMLAWKNVNPPPPQKSACFWYNEVEDKSGKWIGPSLRAVDDAIDKRYWVIEGDGARERRLKCWESYEPQIPSHTDCAVLVLDRRLWGKILEPDHIHRPHCCKDLIGRVLNAQCAWQYFLKSPVFAPDFAHMSWVILLNSPLLRSVPRNSSDLLNELWNHWVELTQNLSLKTKPTHLRLAAGDAKEGDLQWFDLW